MRRRAPFLSSSWAWWLMYRSLLTRRRVNMTLRAMEMAKYGRVNCTVVDVQSDALGRDD